MKYAVHALLAGVSSYKIHSNYWFVSAHARFVRSVVRGSMTPATYGTKTQAQRYQRESRLGQACPATSRGDQPRGAGGGRQPGNAGRDVEPPGKRECPPTVQAGRAYRSPVLSSSSDCGTPFAFGGFFGFATFPSLKNVPSDAMNSSLGIGFAPSFTVKPRPG